MRYSAQEVGFNLRPHLCAPVQLPVPGKDDTANDEIKQFLMEITFLNVRKHVCLQFFPLYM